MKRTALLIAWLLLPVAAVLNAEEPAGEGTLEVFVRDEDGDLTPAMVSINTLPDGLPITFGIDTMRAVKFREKHAEIDHPRFYPLVLFLADTGARLGEALALRWIDVDIEGGTARIRRSFSSGRTLGPTKTGRERVVELSSRLRSVLFDCQLNVYPPSAESSVFPNFSGGMLIPV